MKKIDPRQWRNQNPFWTVHAALIAVRPCFACVLVRYRIASLQHKAEIR